ncbi:glycoside hydrolase/deacetylase [Thozetella sp. PMI_491]|nr:glycoside hydrolase/deacetylase [Thozetella sp. PMI_491]
MARSILSGSEPESDSFQAPVESGSIVTKCKIPGTVAFGFDDGPCQYTKALLDVLDETRTAYFAPVVRRIFQSGHRVAMHGWGHENLDALSFEDRETVLSKFMREISGSRMLRGLVPTYIRPPFGTCSQESGCQVQLLDEGYHVVTWDFDPQDWRGGSHEAVQHSKDAFARRMENADPSTDSLLVILHDIQEQTAKNLSRFALELVQKKGFKVVTVGECIGEPREKWYRRAPVQTMEGWSIYSGSGRRH